MMKKIFTLLLLCSLAFASEAKPMFADRYKKLSQASKEEGFTFKELSKNEIQELFNESDDEQEKELFMQASRIVMIVDVSEKHKGWSPVMLNLLDSYEDLASVTDEDMGIMIKGDLNGDKVKEMIMGLYNDEDFMVLNIKFKNPILLSDYIDIPLQPVIIENTEQGKISTEIQLSGIKLSQNKSETFSLPGYTDDGFTLEVVEADGKYGVRRVGSDEYVVKPKHDHITLLGTNPGNTYILQKQDQFPHYYISDKFGFSLISGLEFTPIYVPDSSELGAVISKLSENYYALYECPEKYELIQEGHLLDGGRLRPHYDYRIFDCKSIEQVSPGVFECVKKDGTTETITIERLKEIKP